MTRTEVIQALQHYGGRATTKQISDFLNQKYILPVLQRMKKWNEVRTEYGEKQMGGRPYIWILNIN